MIVATLCCHVRRYIRVCHLVAHIALQWLYECCMHGTCVGMSERETLRFFLGPAMKDSSFAGLCRPLVLMIFHVPQCHGGFKVLWVCSCVCVVIRLAESVVADRLVIAA